MNQAFADAAEILAPLPGLLPMAFLADLIIFQVALRVSSYRHRRRFGSR